jgi:uncharacterized integral membrane protein
MSTPETRPGSQPPVKKERALASKTIAALAVALLLIAFGVSNNSKVPVDWLVTTTQTPLILVILVSALLGLIIGLLAGRRLTKGSRGGSRSASRRDAASTHRS